MRTFIAFPISGAVKKEAIRLQTEVGRLNTRTQIKWVEGHNMHVTVEFLGEITKDETRKVREVLQDAARKHEPFEYFLGEIDGFPVLSHPGTVILDVEEEDGRSAAFHDAVAEELTRLRILKVRHDWMPHLSLGRVKSGVFNPIGIEKITVDHVVWRVDEADLITSELTPSGPVYKILERFKLGRY